MASITSKMNRLLRQVRHLLVNPREVEALAFAKGEVAAPSTGYTDSGRYWSTASMIGQSLQLDYNLFARYLDYEQMAEYPEICAALNIFADDACITADTEIPMLDGTVRTVGDLYAKGVKDGWVYGFDAVTKTFVPCQFQEVQLISESLPVFRVTYAKEDGSQGSIKATSNHKFMLADGSYARVSELAKGDSILGLGMGETPFTPGMDVQAIDPLSRQANVVSVEPAGNEPIYDLVNSKPTHNFAAGSNGRYVIIKNTQIDIPSGRRVWVESANETVKTVLNDFLHRTLQIERHLWVWARTLCLYGNVFCDITLGPSGVVDVRMLPTPTMRRIEGPRGELYGFVQDFQGRQMPYGPQEFLKMLREQRSGSSLTDQPDSIKDLNNGLYSSVLGRTQAIAFEPWQVIHMRLLSDGQRHVYGLAQIDGARWAWRRLVLMEDASLLYRIQRAPERFAYYIPTGRASAQDTIRMLHYARQQLKKKRYVNSRTGELDLRFNVLAPDEDIFLPVPAEQEPMRVEQLTAPSWQNVDDLTFFLDKLYASIGVPRAYISQEDPNRGQILSGVNVRFARSVLRVQHELTQGIHRVCRVQLAANGIDPDSVDFELRMPMPSSVYELAQMEVRAARADLITRYRDNMSLEWCWRNIEGMNEDQVNELKSQRALEALEAGQNLGVQQAATNQAMGLRPDGQPKDMGLPPPSQEESVDPANIIRRTPDAAQDESTAGIIQRHPYKAGTVPARVVQTFDVMSNLHRQLVLQNPARTQASLDGIVRALNEQGTDIHKVAQAIQQLRASMPTRR